ncbi:hypothetical protein BKA67DRAFT_554844 [Truncatella angustata]|uniref:Uncharacterized protein n=1 Tax=Truncatella angustata TaxID=152316 RepID=A0A9P9A0H8_9PEZI|nr:uncharacterized protein BKA67DRAFT_554844 [Truncatella angustata]KAH6657288.1 hypothetical protein BKA67DRAFT_554844 [Truncatella angustata]
MLTFLRQLRNSYSRESHSRKNGRVPGRTISSHRYPLDMAIVASLPVNPTYAAGFLLDNSVCSRINI